MRILIAAALSLLHMAANASDYCQNQFLDDVRKHDAHLSELFSKNISDDKRVIEIDEARNKLNKASANVMLSDSMSDREKVEKTTPLIKAVGKLDEEKQSITRNHLDRIKEISGYQGKFPELEKKAEQCAREVEPVDIIVNLAVQGLAAYYLKGATALIENKKSLYIDMGEIMHGNISGGENSVVNQGKKIANDILRGTGLQL